MDAKGTFFTTGEFAALCHTTKHTLFHYDETGVFSPALKGENGYRYYSALQADAFSVIANLRAIGMPLCEIKTYMDTRSPERLLALLDGQGEALAARIAALERQRAALAAKAQEVREALAADWDAVVTERRGEDTLLCEPLPPDADDLEMTRCISVLLKRGADAKLPAGHVLGGERETARLAAGDDSGYRCFYLRLTSPLCGAVSREAGDYLVTYHYGDFDTIGAAYERVFRFARERGLALGDTFYEETIIDHLAAFGYEGYLNKVLVRIR